MRKEEESNQRVVDFDLYILFGIFCFICIFRVKWDGGDNFLASL